MVGDQRVWNIRRQDQELVAAEPGDGVVRAQLAFQALADRDQQTVAQAMAEAVVDGLEAIQIEEHQRELIVRLKALALERRFQAPVHLRPIGQLRELIAKGVVAQLQLHLFALADIARDQ